MLVAAYKVLGLSMKKGDLIIPDSLFVPKGVLKVKRLVYNGVEYLSTIPDEELLRSGNMAAAHRKNKN
jgi:hypothetical protein